MTVDSKRLSAAEIQFDKLRPTAPAKKAVAGYETAAIGIGKKTERLKALRLARDVAEAAARPAAPARKKPVKKARAVPEHADDSATVTGWWKDQRDGGPDD